MSDGKLAAEQQRSLEQKELAHYTALVNSWVTTKMEFDKSLITLSGAGIAGLITLLTTVGFLGRVGGVLYCVSVLFFVGTIAIILITLQKNAQHIEDAINQKSPKSMHLRYLDYTSWVCFAVAVITAIGIGVVAAHSKEARHIKDESGGLTNNGLNGIQILMSPPRTPPPSWPPPWPPPR